MVAGLQALDEVRYDDAIAAFTQARDRMPGTTAAAVAAGRIEEAHARQKTTALPVPQTGEKATVLARIVRGKAALAAGDCAAAEEELLSALALGPKDPGEVRRLLRDVRQKRREEEARKSSKRLPT